MPHDLFNSFQEFKLASGGSGKYYALSALEATGLGRVSRMPVSLRIVRATGPQKARNCSA